MPSGSDPYGGDILDHKPKLRKEFPPTPATRGLDVVHRASGFEGRVVELAGDAVVVRGKTGLERTFRNAPGAFTVGRAAVTLVPPPREAPTGVGPRTASGSIAAPKAPARVAATSRIWVEGIHDAELVEKVWGDDLRVEGVVVERLDGIDHLADRVADFGPGPGARLGVLVDHLVAGSKEARIAEDVTRQHRPHVLVTGTPFIDVWQAVKPKVAGITVWPTIPRGTPWKEGVCAFLGVGEPGPYWKHLLGKVRSYADLEPDLVGAVERLIDFVCEPAD